MPVTGGEQICPEEPAFRRAVHDDGDASAELLPIRVKQADLENVSGLPRSPRGIFSIEVRINPGAEAGSRHGRPLPAEGPPLIAQIAPLWLRAIIRACENTEEDMQ